MKCRFFLLTCILFLISVNSFAQRKTRTERFLAEFEWNFTGDYVYQYVLQPNGEELLDGPFSMKGSINDKGLRLNYYQVVDIIGKYTLTGSHSKGDLNGPFAMDANMTVTKRPGSSEAVRYTFRGNFKNGLPHGNFKVEYPSYGTKVNVNYNNGKLVGSFYAKGLGSDDMPFTTSGTLTSTGKPTGTWTFTGVYGTSKKTFSNGVITQLDAYDSALSAKAKAFAAGSISEEQLLKENILVKRDSISVGDDVSDLILNGGIQFRKLGGYDFSQADYVYYNYLERIVTFSTKGIEELTKAFSTYDSAKSIVNSGYNFYGDTASGVYGEFYGGAVNYDNKLNMYYIILPKDSSLSEYCQGYPRWEGNQSRVYFINGQFETIRKSLHDQRMTRLGQKPFAELNRQKINAQYLQNYCFASPYDNDVVAYFSTSDYDTYYYKREDFEDYFINNGLGQQVLEMTPADRQEVVKQKLESYYVKLVEKLFKDAIINKSYETFSNSIDPSCTSEYFPIIEFKAGDISPMAETGMYKIAGEVKVATPAKVTLASLFSFSDNSNNVVYKTYKLNVFIATANDFQFLTRKTFNADNFVRVKNDYDVLSEQEEQITANHNKIKELSKGVFKNSYKTYNTYYKGLDKKIDHNDLKTTIEKKKAVIAVQESAIEFADKLQTVLEADVEIAEKSKPFKDLPKAYSTYASSRDLLWTTSYNNELLDKYSSEQKSVMEFISLRETVQSNDLVLSAAKSAAKNSYKIYTTYLTSCDITWKPGVDFANIKALITLQEKYLEYTKLPNLSSLEKQIKKEKITDINSIVALK